MMELMEFIHAKIIGFWWCPNIKEVLFKTKIKLIECNVYFWRFLVLFGDACDIIYAHYCALTSFHDSTLSLAAKVRSHFHFDSPLYMF